MLIEFSVENFRSFGDRQTLSMVAGKGTRNNEDDCRVVKRGDLPLLKAAAIYGPNASGKSNLVKAFEVMHDTIIGSFKKLTLGDPIPHMVPFRLARRRRRRPSRFRVVFETGLVTYEYEFAATSRRIVEERLTAIPAGKGETVWLTRKYQPKTKEYSWSFEGPVKEAGEEIEKRTRENALAVSVGAALNVEGLAEVFLWFKADTFVLDLSQRPDWLMRATADMMRQHEWLREAVVHAMGQADLGITGLSISEEAESGAPHTGPSAIERRPLLAADDSGPARESRNVGRLNIRTIHEVPGTGAVEEFDFFDDESQGTQRFATIYGLLYVSMQLGDLNVIDELDCSMHPMLLRKLLELFQNKEMNQSGAQLIFTTHDVTLMDPSLLRPDQIWLVEKDQQARSELRSLYDYRDDGVRKTTAFWRNYLAGRYGAVPLFGPEFEQVEIE